MLDLTLFVSGSALFDSISTTQQIIILILLFSTARPVRTSLGYMLGITVGYLVCGLVGLSLVDRLNDMVKAFVPDLGAYSDQAYYQAQLGLGLILVVAGPLYWLYKAKSKKPPTQNRLLAALNRMNFWVALGFGALVSVTSFPSSLVYVASIEKIASAHLGQVAQWGFILLYNFVYALPLVVPFLLFVLLRDRVLPKLHIHVQRLNAAITIAMLSGMGLFLTADSVAFFCWAKPLMQGRFL